jgi:hypothetical protein
MELSTQTVLHSAVMAVHVFRLFQKHVARQLTATSFSAVELSTQMELHNVGTTSTAVHAFQLFQTYVARQSSVT